MSKSETEQRWRWRVSSWKSSGLTSKQYATREGVNAGTLSYWAAELRRRDKAKGVPPLTFVEVSPEAPSSTARFEVELPTGVRVQVPIDFNAAALRRLLAVLEVSA